MSTCTRPREDLLVAEPDELRGLGHTGTAEHVRSCADCSAVAAAILRSMDVLDEALGDDAPDLDVRVLIERAQGGDAERRTKRVLHLPSRRRWTAVAVAASLVGLFFLSAREKALPGVPLTTVVRPIPTVAASSGNVAIIETDNPDITVLWFF